MKLLLRLKELIKLSINKPPQKIENIIPQLINPEVRKSKEEQENHPD